MTRFTYRRAKNGDSTDVYFEEQEDKRFRSSQLLPDEEITLTAKA